MKSLHTTLKIAIFIILPLLVFSQAKRTMTFINGYYGAPPPGTWYKNNIWVERRDTGLYFSERITSKYDFESSQNVTYCDQNGKPLLQWQGCFLLDGNLEPINNGDFSNGPGTHDNLFNSCDKWKHPSDNAGDGIIKSYPFSGSTFFLDRGNTDIVKLIYYRRHGLPSEYKFFIYTAEIDMKGGPDGKPTVVYKDSLLDNNIRLATGSINAIRHANGYDWFIVFGEHGSYNWYSVLYDRDGLHEPVKTPISQWKKPYLEVGKSAISANGLKYIYHSDRDQFIILDFDRCNGIFNFFKQDSIPDEEVKVSEGHNSIFSPNGRFLYLNNFFKIYQYDMEDPDFHNSRTLIAEFDTSQVNDFPPKGYFSTPISGLDNKLYYWSVNSARHVHRIAFPNQKGPDVGWTQDFYTLPTYPTWFTPTLIDYGMGSLEGSPCISSTNENHISEVFSIYPNPASDIIKASFDQKYEKANLIIYDGLGKTIYKGVATDLRHGINISTWSSGVYIVSVDGKSLSRFAKM